MRQKILRVRKSVAPKHLTPKLGEPIRLSIVNLVNSESESLIAIPSQYDESNAERLSKHVTSISDADSMVFLLDKEQSSIIENSSISDFQSLYGLIPNSICCGVIISNKKDIEAVITPERWVIDNQLSAFMMLVDEGNALAVYKISFQCCARLFVLNYYRIWKLFSRVIFKEILTP